MMSSAKRSSSTEICMDDISLIYVPTSESHEEFKKRLDDVQAIVVRMIRIGQKKGRIALKEVMYEDAA